ncbi:MAG: MBL fold metallo-hydrolase [Salinivirgaceae bacterium]|nr:MBL fold metallo-hydrolase [Salinivirgaceae bacterium]
MKITMLGTGNAFAYEHYNTCFTISHNNQIMLVDGGGGNELLHRLKNKSIDWQDIKHVFVTHKHIDHILGIVWLIRLVCQRAAAGKYNDTFHIYANADVVNILQNFTSNAFSKSQASQLGKAVQFITLSHADQHEIIGHTFRFFDIGSTKCDQMGFAMENNGNPNYLCCLGDEPYNAICQPFAQNCTWLMHESFCLFTEADDYQPYEKHHSTVKDAAQAAQKLNAKNLIIYHTNDAHANNRKQIYTNEASLYYSGNIHIPNDLEEIEI